MFKYLNPILLFRNGIFHRDVKPENILVKVCDSLKDLY